MEVNLDKLDSLSAEFSNEVVLGIENFLTTFATDEASMENRTFVFGDSFNEETAEELRQSIESLNITNLGAVTSDLLEETRSYSDSRINTSDIARNEGAFFSDLAPSETYSTQQLELPKTEGEDDSATVALNGQTVQIEQAKTAATLNWQAIQIEPAATAETGVFGPDGRTQATNTTSFWESAVGRMRMTWSDGTQSTASGAMIDPYHFLTAGHCVYDDKGKGWATKIEVMLGSKGNIIPSTNPSRADYQYYGEASLVYMRSYTNWTTNKDFNYDLGLVTLDRNIGNYTSWFQYGYDNNLSSGNTVNVAGYLSDKFDSNSDGFRDNYNMWFQSGKLTSTTDLTLRSNELDIISGI